MDQLKSVTGASSLKRRSSVKRPEDQEEDPWNNNRGQHGKDPWLREIPIQDKHRHANAIPKNTPTGMKAARATSLGRQPSPPCGKRISIIMMKTKNAKHRMLQMRAMRRMSEGKLPDFLFTFSMIPSLLNAIITSFEQPSSW
jgi:hypothetical protein